MIVPDDLSTLREKPLAEAVGKFDSLLDQNSRAFLLGAGCSKSAGLPLATDLTDKTIGSDQLDATSKAILTTIKDLFEGASFPNIEDYLSELIDLLAIADRREEREAKQRSVPLGGINYSKAQLLNATDQIKRGIAKVIEAKVSIQTHRDFVNAVHRNLRVGRLRPIVEYLVLNYDTVLEDALALERIPFADGIDGGVTGWWNPRTFDREGLAARVLKLHGSMDWCEFPDDPLPRRIGPSLEIKGIDDRRILIWPASTKYRETQLDPYAQLVERTRGVLRPTLGMQRVLVICGYSFRDKHINIEVDRALRESSGNLTIVAFTQENEPVGPLRAWYEDTGVRDQVLIFANRGFFHSTRSETTTIDLLWWKFENVTRLIRGER